MASSYKVCVCVCGCVGEGKERCFFLSWNARLCQEGEVCSWSARIELCVTHKWEKHGGGRQAVIGEGGRCALVLLPSRGEHTNTQMAVR